ncbi:LppA family lipoprotein [Saccharomonospora iraqiensis]|uniref:LppA family lipoprotein n=1 Tax=Saccharomonospora iraqiensis TaxID=52698 RepID=UPI00047DEAA7|nr:LppA family lipoprotein [Saccharomonospora iraqiensis]
MTDASPQEKIAELAKRPDIDTVLDQYERIRTEIRERLAEELGLAGEWRRPYNESETPCGRPYSDIGDAVAVQMASSANDTHIPDDEWPRAKELFVEIAGRYGFGDPRVIVNEPGNHEIRVRDRFGGDIMLGTEKATVLSSGTGCHLIQGAGSGEATPAPG